MTRQQAGLAPAAAPIAGAAKFGVLSCDVFETVVWRILAQPGDLYLAAGYRARRAGLISCAPDAFAVYRATAEQRVRARVEASGDDDIQIGEIYQELAACGVLAAPEEGAAIEFAVECVVCRPVTGLRDSLHDMALRAPATRRIFISDTYWPGDRLAALLRHCGFGDACEVFSSADLRRSKHTGRLFDAVLARLNCAPARVLHIGDNPVSDVRRARERGLQARHVQRYKAGKSAGAASADTVVRLAESVARARRQDPELTPPAGAAADGVALAALATPLLIGFAMFVLARARALGVRRIYFLARDGYLPLAICQRLLRDCGEADAFELNYLHVSRAAMQDTEAARTYLAATGFFAPGDLLVVDLGWRGTVQEQLAALRGAVQGTVYGAYLGLWQDALRPALGVPLAQGYLCSFGAPTAREAVLRECYIVFELLFSAPHGTVLGYQSGAPVLENEAAAGAARHAAFTAFSCTCLEIIDAVGQLLSGDWPASIDADAALAPLLPLLTRPTHADVAMINRIPFIHGAGALQPAVNPLPLHEALLHPRKSLQRLRNAPWRAGAVRAALPWPAPFMSFADLEYRVRWVRW